MALDTLWVTTLSGAKLSASQGAAVAERLSDFLNQCAPRAVAAAERQTLTCSDVCVDSSEESEDCTLVRVRADPSRNGQLLDVASTLSGLGITIREAELEEHGGVATWAFRVLSAKGTKLEYAESASLLFLLGTIGSQTSVPM